MKTGGLQEQPVDDQGNIFGVLVEPKTRSLQGSQQIPYIWDMLGTNEDWLNAYLQMYNLSWDERKELGRKGSEWVRRAYSMENMISAWDRNLTKYIEMYKNNAGPSRVKIVKV